jgi:hypothetical protein
MTLLEQLKILVESVSAHCKKAHEHNRAARESDQVARKLLGME